MQKNIFILLLIVNTTLLKAQDKATESIIKWFTLEQALELNEKEPKTIMVDMYTDWCSWCKHMDKTTFSNPQIANYINKYFYPVKFNAERTDSVLYKGKWWKNNGTGRRPTHDLAMDFMNGRASYPTLVYFDLDGNKNAVPGYQKVTQMEPLMYFFAERIYQGAQFNDFQKYFQYTYSHVFTEELTKISPANQADTTGIVKWYTLQEALDAAQKTPKKIYVDIYGSWMISGKVMNKTSYTDPKVANYLNENFYPVRFEATSKDIVNFGGQQLNNPGTQHPFHQFAVNFFVTGNRYYLPTLVFFDEQIKPVSRVQHYLAPETLYDFLLYIGSNTYKTKDWKTYKGVNN